MVRTADGRVDLQQAYRAAAQKLVRKGTTLVLATAMNGRTWCAPVYYVYLAGDFYFYSSPNARHSRHVEYQGQCAASIFSEGDGWESIEGIQMGGTVQKVEKKSQFLKASAKYLAKFPIAGKLLSADMAHLVDSDGPRSVCLYRFRPTEIFYGNNRLGFGKRVMIRFD